MDRDHRRIGVFRGGSERVMFQMCMNDPGNVRRHALSSSWEHVMFQLRR